MTDKQIVVSIIKQCKNNYMHDTPIWYSIFNDQDQCIKLYLSCEELTKMPKEILYLKHLNYLDLSYNKLKEIPKEIYKLKHLKHLDFFDNDLTEIPGELLALKHLKHLNLNFNKLTYIPDELSYIKELCTYGNPILESKDKVELLFNKNFKNN